MGRFKGLAQEILTDPGFPGLPDQGQESRIPNFYYPSEDQPVVTANLEARQLQLASQALSGVHIHWVTSSDRHAARHALNNALELSYRDGIIVDAVSGRVTTLAVLDLVKVVLGEEMWDVYVSVGGQAFGLNDISWSPSCVELERQLLDNVDSGSPFVAFSPTLTQPTLS